MDESYILSSHTPKKSWSDDSSEGLLAPVSRTERLIIIHAGGESGFVPGALLMWKANQASGDYHHQMNKDNYEKWMKEKVIPNLPPNSVIILDNASYHNVAVDKASTSTSTKTKMMDWLTERKIPFSHRMLKPELYTLIQLNNPIHRIFSVNNIL